MDIFINIDLNTFLDVSFFACPRNFSTSQHKTVEICTFLYEVSVKILGYLFFTYVAFYALRVYNRLGLPCPHASQSCKFPQRYIVLSPYPTHKTGKGLVTFKQFLGCAKSAKTCAPIQGCHVSVESAHLQKLLRPFPIFCMGSGDETT